MYKKKSNEPVCKHVFYDIFLCPGFHSLKAPRSTIMLCAPHDQFVWVCVTRFKVARSTKMLLSAPHDQFVLVCITRFKVPRSTTMLCAPHDHFVWVCVTRFKAPCSTIMLCAPHDHYSLHPIRSFSKSFIFPFSTQSQS